MWFSNALIFQFELDSQVNLETALEPMKPCPPHARSIYGWLPAIAGEMVHQVAGATLICMGKEERILPKAVIKRLLAEKIQALELNQNRTVKRAEKAQLAEELEFELLPKSFCVQKRQFALLDTVDNRIIVNCASNNQASQLISLLRKSVAGIKIEPFLFTEDLAVRFTEWINNPALLPENFKLASDCLLVSLDDEKKRFTCKGFDLPAEEIVTLISQGLAAAEISLIWNERIQFTLTHDFTLKRIKSLDYLIDEFNDIRKLDEEYQQKDAALTLLSGELRALINDLSKIINKEAPVISMAEEELAIL
ncbi:exonuclease involved in removal of stalled replication fork (plasmid) [Legionella adelaidensis]|uniref:Recombination-associated protein RdgC n=1 Tax=Legionella adelaidensis TaxID=45056 RepID=A0A0W0R444_9GAMM|nr:recombination-associated protein RdgC [Legionella adelaidensis]KTC65802.1 exonuclease involved in removal of stalled replication fork [Legionella adelaidensis]VEH85230.1 exonuclease involved in removal of stalled replication fork [Legionella adelaidensis]